MILNSNFMRHRTSLKASEEGKKIIKQARAEKIQQAKDEKRSQGKNQMAWSIDDEIFIKKVSQILDPNRNWDNIKSETEYLTSNATWRRFREAKQGIEAETFKLFCQVLELNWQDVAENEANSCKDLSEAPPISNFYGRTKELGELYQSLIPQRCRLVVIHGVGGIGKTALARQVVEKIVGKYNYLIWRSLNSTPPFSELLTELVQFLSRGQEHGYDISQLIQYLRKQRCLIVLDDWEEIIGDNSEDSSNYYELLRRVTREAHKSCLLLLSREKPHNIEILEGELVYCRKIGLLNCEDAKSIFQAEGIDCTENELDALSGRYNNPVVIKKIAKTLKNVYGGEVSDFISDFTTYVDDDITNFLDEQFQKLSALEKNIIYWVAIKRNSASWKQLKLDIIRPVLSLDEILINLRLLIERWGLVEKLHLDNRPILYTLDPVTLKYITKRFVEENCHEIIQVMKSQRITGDELFISHSFITKNPEDEQLNQEQITRIVQPIYNKLLNKLRGQQQVEEGLRKVLFLLKEKKIQQSYAIQNVLSLLLEV